MPEISPIIITIWGFLVFVVWYFYRHHERKNRAAFLKIVSIITVLFFFIQAGLWMKNPAPDDPTRIGIFPFTNKSLTWQALAFSEVPACYLRHFNDEQTLTYPADWIMESANPDSLGFRKYIHSFAPRIKLDWAVYGNYVRESSGYAVTLAIFDVTKQKVVQRDTLTFPLDGIDALATSVHDILAPHVPGFRKEKNDVRWPPEHHWIEYFKARFHVLHGHEAAAVRLLEEVAARDSSAMHVLTLLGELYLKRASKLNGREQDMKTYRRARDVLRRAVSGDGNAAKAQLLLGELYMENERWNQAEGHLRHALATDPWRAETYIALARLHPERYDDLGFSGEDELLERASLIHPGAFRARLLLADFYQTENRMHKAYAEVRKVLAINPESVDGFMALGRLYMFENKQLKVLETFERIVKLSPGNADAYYNLGIAHYHQKEYELAIRFFQRAIAISNHANAHLYLAHVYEEQGDTSKAIAHLRERIRQRKSEDDPFYLQARSRLFEIMANSGAIDSVMSRATDSNPSDQVR